MGKFQLHLSGFLAKKLIQLPCQSVPTILVLKTVCDPKKKKLAIHIVLVTPNENSFGTNFNQENRMSVTRIMIKFIEFQITRDFKSGLINVHICNSLDSMHTFSKTK